MLSENGGGPPSKMHGLRLKIHLKSPLAPPPEPQNSIQCHLLRAHSPRIYIRSFPNFLCPYLRARAFGKWWGAPFENARIEAKNPSEITLSTPAGNPELDSMPPSKGPFSANIHPIIPKLSVPIPQGMCFRKMVGAPFETFCISSLSEGLFLGT